MHDLSVQQLVDFVCGRYGDAQMSALASRIARYGSVEVASVFGDLLTIVFAGCVCGQSRDRGQLSGTNGSLATEREIRHAEVQGKLINTEQAGT